MNLQSPLVAAKISNATKKAIFFIQIVYIFNFILKLIHVLKFFLIYHNFK